MVGGALVVLGTEWAVRRRKLAHAAWWPRAIRRWSDPLLQPIERRLLRAGANPTDAPLWLLGVSLVIGALAIGTVHWISSSITFLLALRGAGPAIWIRIALNAVLSLLMAAILVRVIASWLGAGRFHRWIRPAYRLTDWIIEPIARRLPSRGLVDFSPFVAYLILLVARLVVDGMLS